MGSTSQIKFLDHLATKLKVYINIFCSCCGFSRNTLFVHIVIVNKTKQNQTKKYGILKYELNNGATNNDAGDKSMGLNTLAHLY